MSGAGERIETAPPASGRRHRLRTRLVVSHVLVALVAAVAVLVVVALWVRSGYDRQLRGLGFARGHGRGPAGGTTVTESDLLDALDDTLVNALAVGAVAAVLAAVVASTLLGRRLLRPLDQVRAATRRIAAGDLTATAPTPRESELAALANDVNALGRHLATTEHRRTQLLAEVTHELRTPVTVIRGRMEALLDGVVQPEPAVFASVIDETARLERLVDDLGTLSRAEEGTLRLEQVALDLGEIASTAVDRLRPQFDDAGVAIVVERDAGSVPVTGDPARLAQVVANLLGNALGHTPSGGTVRVGVVASGATARLDVTDTGTGIASDELDRIFERFYRGTEPSIGRPVRAGRGIGLTIARSLARAHGGDLTATSPGPGQGATFRLSLPLRH